MYKLRIIHQHLEYFPVNCLLSVIPSAPHIHLWEPGNLAKHYIYFVFLCSWLFQHDASNLLIMFLIFIASKRQLHSVLFQIFWKNIYDGDGQIFFDKAFFDSRDHWQTFLHCKPQAHCQNLGRTWVQAFFNEVLQKPEPLHQKWSNKTVSVLTTIFVQIIFWKQKPF